MSGRRVGEGRVIEFAKAHGCGNDFLIVNAAQADGREMAALARAMCARTIGVGADGVEFLTMRSEREGAIRLYNADGSVAEISGNGTRCVAAWMAYRAKLSVGAEVVLETDAGLRVCRLEAVNGAEFQFTTGMGVPAVGAKTVRLVDGTEITGAAIDMGNPQFVALADDDDFTMAGRPWQEVGAAICTHPDFLAGTNVELVRRRGVDAIEIRIHERGVGPTSSSGTGTSASAAMMMALHGAPRRLRVLAPGGEQVVAWPESGAELMLTGPAVVLATGQWLAGAM